MLSPSRRTPRPRSAAVELGAPASRAIEARHLVETGRSGPDPGLRPEQLVARDSAQRVELGSRVALGAGSASPPAARDTAGRRTDRPGTRGSGSPSAEAGRPRRSRRRWRRRPCPAARSATALKPIVTRWTSDGIDAAGAQDGVEHGVVRGDAGDADGLAGEVGGGADLVRVAGDHRGERALDDRGDRDQVEAALARDAEVADVHDREVGAARPRAAWRCRPCSRAPGSSGRCPRRGSSRSPAPRRSRSGRRSAGSRGPGSRPSARPVQRRPLRSPRGRRPRKAAASSAATRLIRG